MADLDLTLKQVVDYCQEHELLLRLLGIAENEIIHHNSVLSSPTRENNKRKAIDDNTRSAIAELVSLGILRLELRHGKRTLFPGELWKDRLAILRSHEDQ